MRLTRRLRRRTGDTDVDVAPLDAFACGLVVVVGAVVFVVASDLFAYHSVNDDEGVYLLQAAMLLDGQVFLRPEPAIADLVRPWFFVHDPTPTGPRLYSKYAPVPAATFAVGRLLGEARLSLAAVAAGNAAFVYLLARRVADRFTGVVAAGLLATAPLFLLTSAVFLPYAPTTLWNLAFAVAYLRSLDRTGDGGSLPAAVAAGVAVGVAFFARPYTAVLFAAPFVGHALVRLVRARGSRERFRRTAVRTAAIAVPGLAFVGATLGYNALLTGSPTTFPYEAFAPRDGIGFGRRSLLGYSERYTPSLAVESTRDALDLLVTRFAPLGALGAALAAVGAASALRIRSVDREAAALVLGIVPSVVVGNAYFWGTLNGLRNGLIDLLGPYYHFDLLVPLSVFGALGAVTLWRHLRELLSARFSRRRVRVALALVLVVSAPVAAGAERAALADPWDANRERTENLAATYAPFDRLGRGDDALVFTPDPYGDWQQHPFQYLRNDPGFDGPVLYVLDEGPDADVRALDATDRTPYRFTYRGEWTGAVRPVDPELTRLRTLDGDRVEAVTRVGVPRGATAASIRVETEEGFARYRAPDVTTDRTVPVTWTISADGVRVTDRTRTAGPPTVPLPEGASEVDLVVRFSTTGAASVTYRQEVTVDVTDGADVADERGEERLRALWPPETRVCRLRPECGREGTWVGSDGEYLDGVSVETRARAVVDET